jgi:drug/metabolite transporter (DMT)-like permease
MEAYRSDRLDRGQNETELVQPNDRGAAMTLKLLPIGLIITSLVSYQLSQRMMPTGANPFTIVAIVYFSGIFACALLAPRVGTPIGLADVALLRHWPVWVLAGSVVGMEVGYLLVYRVGWPIGTTTGITYTATMVLLAVISATCFSEGISPRRTAGLALAIGGVWLLVTPARTP